MKSIIFVTFVGLLFPVIFAERLQRENGPPKIFRSPEEWLTDMVERFSDVKAKIDAYQRVAGTNSEELIKQLGIVRARIDAYQRLAKSVIQQIRDAFKPMRMLRKIEEKTIQAGEGIQTFLAPTVGHCTIMGHGFDCLSLAVGM
ncbi:uncharacterized protein LOC141853543 [Brevipalpus obovatus]|uniref:uncharacterized protein LOC141853543 n=1 Tax=Brevipalpus obovatus TaxID=246614 RepID=UPI003D9EC664